MDLLMDIASTKDLVFTNGECPVATDLTMRVAQKLLIVLKTDEGEWFLDTTTGVPYTSQILGKKITKTSVDNILQAKILGVDGVKAITYFSSTYDTSKRTYTVNFRVSCTDGSETQTISI